MDAMAIRKEFFLTNDPIREAGGLVDEMVTDIRNRGFTRDVAVAECATLTGLSVTWLKKLVYGNAERISQEQKRAIDQAYLSHLENEEEHYRRKIDAARLRHQQSRLSV